MDRVNRLSVLLVVSACILLFFLPAREIWTQEHRWADIVAGMFYRHDFLHPYLGENFYYDKPLLSYWFVVAATKLLGGFTLWSLRLPSALAGLLTVWSTYRLGSSMRDERFGMLAGWMLVTTFSIVFWSRIMSADMLNVAGIMLALVIYHENRDHAGIWHYTQFFIVIALTSLCKGLIGAVVPIIAIGIDILLRGSWKQHCKLVVLVAMIPALAIYFFPFWASMHFGGTDFAQDGLTTVFHENIVRYFKPFDHQGPIYIYLINLPLFLLPWTIFFIPALMSVRKRWVTMAQPSQWIAITLAVLFVFFTLSGSRRNYYVLPMIPFAILFTADWLRDASIWRNGKEQFAKIIMLATLMIMISNAAQFIFYHYYGVGQFANRLIAAATQHQSWEKWQIVLLDGETKLNYYLHLPPNQKNYPPLGGREAQNAQTVLRSWPVLVALRSDTIYISRQRYLPFIASYFTRYQQINEESPNRPLRMTAADGDELVAFIPRNVE